MSLLSSKLKTQLFSKIGQSMNESKVTTLDDCVVTNDLTKTVSGGSFAKITFDKCTSNGEVVACPSEPFAKVV